MRGIDCRAQKNFFRTFLTQKLEKIDFLSMFPMKKLIFLGLRARFWCFSEPTRRAEHRWIKIFLKNSIFEKSIFWPDPQPLQKIGFSKIELFEKIFIKRCSARRIGSEKHQDCVRDPKNTSFFIGNMLKKSIFSMFWVKKVRKNFF